MSLLSLATLGLSASSLFPGSCLAVESYSVIVTAVGYAQQTFKVSNIRGPLNVNLAAATNQLDQVVVVGYGTQRKKDVTGSVASVNIEALWEAPNTNIGQLLQGTVPGLNVGLSTFAGGTPPINNRGVTTIGGNQSALIVLDGIQYTMRP